MYSLSEDVVHGLFMASFRAAMRTGEAIMDVFHSDNDRITAKSDNSIISMADQIAHRTIEKLLASTRIPLISEEGRRVEYEERKSWELFWLVDPLDGTRQFVKKKTEFTVNIALMINNYPATGLIYAPALGQLYFAIKGRGAYRFSVDVADGEPSSLAELEERSVKLPSEHARAHRRYVVLTSPNHVNRETMKYIEERRGMCDELLTKNVGSSLKMCLLAAGEADAYPRHAATYEWDTAAAQVILEEAGCSIRSLETGELLAYNKESLLNPCFVCTTKRSKQVFSPIAD